MAADTAGQQPVGGVQSVQRALAVLETVAEAGPLTLSELAERSGLPLTTIHRLTGTLASLGYLHEQSPRRYALGLRMVHLGERARGPLSTGAVPHLAALVDQVGETANLAMLDGDRVVYVAQAPSRHSMRMFTEVGRRVPLHCTAVGKAVLAALGADEARRLLARNPMEAVTDRTETSVARLTDELSTTRERGYALDEGEQEVGVHCVAVALAIDSPRLAVSVSGPATRMDDALVERAVPALARAAAALARDLAW